MAQCGKYRLLYKIAQGGMAEIFAAKGPGESVSESGATAPITGGGLICIKQIRREFSDDPDFLQMFEQEARIAMSLTHPNIVRVFDFETGTGPCFLAMEFVDGWDLKKILATARDAGVMVPIGFAFKVFRDVLAALHEASSVMVDGVQRTIVHRDISPHNILVSRAGEVKLTDFGIARARGSSRMTRTGVIKGKLTYLSPEQATGGEVGPSTDLYGLGLVLYEMLTAERFHHGVSEGEILASVMNPPPCEIPWLSAEINGFLNRLLAVQVEHRFASAADAAASLTDLSLPPCSISDAGLFLYGLITSATRGGTSEMEPALVQKDGRESLSVLGDDVESRAPSVRMGRGGMAQRRTLRLVIFVLAVLGIVAVGAVWGAKRYSGGAVVDPDDPGNGMALSVAQLTDPVLTDRGSPSAADGESRASARDMVLKLSSDGQSSPDGKADDKSRSAKRVRTSTPDSREDGQRRNITDQGKRQVDKSGKSSSGNAQARSDTDNGTGESGIDRPDKKNNATVRTGNIQVMCRPWAYVRIDGEPHGTTPLLNHSLKEGKHQLELVNEEMNYHKRMTVNIRHDTTTKISERIE